MKGVYIAIAVLGILALAFTFYHLYSPESCAPPEPKSQEEAVFLATNTRECAFRVAQRQEAISQPFKALFGQN